MFNYVIQELSNMASAMVPGQILEYQVSVSSILYQCLISESGCHSIKCNI